MWSVAVVIHDTVPWWVRTVTPSDVLRDYAITASNAWVSLVAKQSLEVATGVLRMAPTAIGAAASAGEANVDATTGAVIRAITSVGSQLWKLMASLVDPWLAKDCAMLYNSATVARCLGKALMISGGVWLGLAWLSRSLPAAFEQEGPSCLNPYIEVTQEAPGPSGLPVYVVPRALRDSVVEMVMLQERTKELLQRVKQHAGRWCEDHDIQGSKRLSAVSGAVACALTVSVEELDLLQLGAQPEAVTARQALVGLLEPTWLRRLLGPSRR